MSTGLHVALTEIARGFTIVPDLFFHLLYFSHKYTSVLREEKKIATLVLLIILNNALDTRTQILFSDILNAISYCQCLALQANCCT